ncbi:unnamed protein product [Ilex paraguariensis]|uniref:Uncharacterized protein n=1 Tax=Ilex paraguariensis TaxID=185542 RepID=A0ABC8U971_9AQUA
MGGRNEISMQPESFASEKRKSLTELTCDGHPSRPSTPSSFGVNSVVACRSSLQDREDTVEAVSRVTSQNELAVLRSFVSGFRWIAIRQRTCPRWIGGSNSHTPTELGLSGKSSWQAGPPDLNARFQAPSLPS